MVSEIELSLQRVAGVATDPAVERRTVAFGPSSSVEYENNK